MPESRRPSRAPSPDSTDTLRWTASTVQNSTATQNSPGAPLAIRARSGPRAKANRTRATIPNGATWDSATRERASIRRSLPATRRVSRHMGHRLLGRRPVAAGPARAGGAVRRAVGPRIEPLGGHPATGDGDRPAGQRLDRTRTRGRR